VPTHRKAASLDKLRRIKESCKTRVERLLQEIDEGITPEFSQNMVELPTPDEPERDQYATDPVTRPPLVLECPVEVLLRQEPTCDQRFAEPFSTPG
jgi:hypothetical protein